MTPTMRPLLVTVTAICAAFAPGASKLIASDSQPLTYFRTLPLETATVWKACLEETKDSRGYRIESSHRTDEVTCCTSFCLISSGPPCG